MPGYRTKPPKGSLLQRGHPLARGLVAAYLFNEGSGLTAYDSAGRNNGTFGALTAAPTWSRGGFGKCPLFDGSNDLIDTPPSPVFAASAGTASCWFRCGVQGSNRRFLSLAHSANDRAEVFMNGSTLAVFVVSSGSTVANISFVGGADSTWHHAAVTWGQSGTVLYLDGVARASSGTNSAVAWPSSPFLRIGNYAFSTAFGLAGSIDAVSIYNRALSAREVSALRTDPFAAFRRKPLLKSPLTGLLLKRRRAALS